uniref:PAS domain-containing protein n=1 Tax=Romanomermis culicivorax TaxID=13658 RepID=A0A915IC73_ROMCU
MPGAKRGLVAPQNTFLENVIRRSNNSELFKNAKSTMYLRAISHEFEQMYFCDFLRGGVFGYWEFDGCGHVAQKIILSDKKSAWVSVEKDFQENPECQEECRTTDDKTEKFETLEIRLVQRDLYPWQESSNFILANAQIVDYPIVYCNDGFSKMVGYSRAEVMHRSCSCSFMYGDQTDKDTIKLIENCLHHYATEQLEIRLYKKNISGIRIGSI